MSRRALALLLAATLGMAQARQFIAGGGIWTKKNVEMAGFGKAIAKTFDSVLLVMEAGSTFAPTKPDGWPGQLEHNGPYPARMSSPEGQRDFKGRAVPVLDIWKQFTGMTQ